MVGIIYSVVNNLDEMWRLESGSSSAGHRMLCKAHAPVDTSKCCTQQSYRVIIVLIIIMIVIIMGPLCKSRLVLLWILFLSLAGWQLSGRRFLSLVLNTELLGDMFLQAINIDTSRSEYRVLLDRSHVFDGWVA